MTSSASIHKYTVMRQTLWEPKLQVKKRAKVSKNFRSREQKGRAISLQGAKVPGSKMARERNGRGSNWTGSYWPIRSWERMGPGAKRLGTKAVYSKLFCRF